LTFGAAFGYGHGSFSIRGLLRDALLRMAGACDVEPVVVIAPQLQTKGGGSP
jgi:hypothetical protein